MITLVQFPIAKEAGIGNFSPFCLKLETYLKAVGVDYQVENFKGDPAKGSPKGKLPFIRHKDQDIADSTLIIEWLRQHKDIDLDQGLDAKLHAHSFAYQRMIEDHLGQALLYFRWQDSSGWERTREPFFGSLPVPLKWFVPNLVRKQMIRQLWEKGMGRHLKTEVQKFVDQDLFALDQLLGEKEFLLDEQFRTLDATAYGMLANFAHPINPELKERIDQFPHLIRYVQTIQKKFWL